NFKLDGSFTYTPNNNFTGTDTFSYRAFDGTDLSNTATVTITVSTFHVPPTAANDTYSTARNQTLNVPATGVLSNDSGSGTLTVDQSSITGPTSGTLTLNIDGSFSYVPNPGFAGIDSFTYKANDGTVDSAAATVTITVNNTAPIANNESYSVPRNGTLTITA